jgi:hypothetical protein
VYIAIGNDYTNLGPIRQGSLYYNVIDDGTPVTLNFIDENGNGIPFSGGALTLTTDGPYQDSTDILLGVSRNDNDPTIYKDFLYGGEITEFLFYDSFITYDTILQTTNSNISTSNIWGPYSKTLDYKYIINAKNYYTQIQSNIEYDTSTNIPLVLIPIIYDGTTYDRSNLFAIYLQITVTQYTSEIIRIKNDATGFGIRIYRDTGDQFLGELIIGKSSWQTNFPVYIGTNTIIIQNGYDFYNFNPTVYFFINSLPYNVSSYSETGYNESYMYNVTYDTGVSDYRFYNRF